MLSKAAPSSLCGSLGRSTSEDLADTIYEISQHKEMEHDDASALHWLEKAYDLLAPHNIDRSGSAANELHAVLSHSLARVLLKVGGEANKIRAWKIVEETGSRAKDLPNASLLKLNLFSLDQTSSARDYHDVLLHYVRTVYLTDSSLKIILHLVGKLKTRDTHMAYQVLISLLSERLLASETNSWIEKAVIMIVWIFPVSKYRANDWEMLKEAFDLLVAKPGLAFTSSATHAAQIVCT